MLEKELLVVMAGGRSVSVRISGKICPDVEQKALLAQLPGRILLQGSVSEALRKPRAEREQGWEGLRRVQIGHLQA